MIILIIVYSSLLSDNSQLTRDIALVICDIENKESFQLDDRSPGGVSFLKALKPSFKVEDYRKKDT